ncbi:hypothetical protein OEZ85_011850 [Tetradesmus obliquus]|uniref:Crossover junction endonuclease MUS81 n=1 Tax=Tetradesmus obliquus TaxID=3088 RepID=A0ABY8TRM3_TETOB|nr:hypothetical protein OEZ85_011850 [Tetradesmus obliquus]
MPRKEPLNDKIVEALENRKRNCQLLRNDKEFTYGTAIAAIKAVRTNITRAAHVLDLKICRTMREEIVDIINGTAPVDVAGPSPRQLRNAERLGPNREFRNPPAKGAGSWCILLALHNAQGRDTLTKDQIIRWAGSHLHVNLNDGAAGHTKWSGCKTLENNGWMRRKAYSRMYGGGGTAGFGGRKDEFELTEGGSRLAAILWEQHFGAGGGPSTAAAAAGRQQHRHSASPAGLGGLSTTAAAAAARAGGLDAVFDQLTTGPEFINPHGGAAAAAAAAAGRASAGVSPFTGRGRVLGGGRGSSSSGRRLEFDRDDELSEGAADADMEGFIENERALELPMVLSKKGLAHVQQTVGWLMAPQGGGWALQMAVADDKKSVTICKLQDAAPAAGSKHMQAAAAAPGVPAHNPLAALESMLRMQQQQQQMCIELLESQDAAAAGGLGLGLADLDDAMQQDGSTAAAAAAAAAAGNPGSRCPGTCATGGNVPGASGGTAGSSRAATDEAAAAAAAAAAGSGLVGSSSTGFELKLVVDDKERRSEDDYLKIFSNIRQEHMRLQQLLQGATLDVDRDRLPLGDYTWLMLPAGAAPSAADADSEDEQADERAAAAERAACVLAGAVVERKTMRDLVGRSAAGDHIRQLQRMYQLRELVPLQLLLLENLSHMAGRYTVYQPGPGSSTAACTVDSEASLFDFIVRAAVSPYGGTQRILLTPSEGDTRAVLLAMSQLLLHEMQQLQRHAANSTQQQQQQQQQHKLLAATQTSYPEFASLCQQVNHRLPRSQLPIELCSMAAVSPVSPEVAFSVTRGAAKTWLASAAVPDCTGH